ncbi:MAG: hypothetical protein JW871_07830 [Endomicrobiales bacterium]|nr:hypothetical protein [Endomicrobiales bacterium]
MRKRLVIGILRETKEFEKRAPLTPHDVSWLIKKGIEVEVESSASRIYPDSQYKKAGAKIVNRFNKANLLIGIKEPKIKDLYADKLYMIFSHTAKGQRHNIPLLKACFKNKITLIDYEKITDIHGKRLVYFGRFAGICGIIDSLYYFGKKLEWRNIKNPFFSIKPSREYKSLKEVKASFAKTDYYIRNKGFDKRLSPFIIGITGHGNVSRGVQEILSLLNPTEIHPRDIVRFVKHQKGIRNKLYKIVFFREEKFRSKKRTGFYFEEYLSDPQNFESNMDVYLPYLNMLVHTSYWDKRYPKIVTYSMINKLYKSRPFRMDFIGDLSCDVNGSVELTCKATNPETPTFTYSPKNKRFVDGYNSEGITVLAVDNLPAELPLNASIDFSSLIKEYVYQIAEHGVFDITNHTALPKEIRNATILQNGKITKNYEYLKKSL